MENKVEIAKGDNQFNTMAEDKIKDYNTLEKFFIKVFDIHEQQQKMKLADKPASQQHATPFQSVHHNLKMAHFQAQNISDVVELVTSTTTSGSRKPYHVLRCVEAESAKSQLRMDTEKVANQSLQIQDEHVRARERYKVLLMAKKSQLTKSAATLRQGAVGIRSNCASSSEYTRDLAHLRKTFQLEKSGHHVAVNYRVRDIGTDTDKGKQLLARGKSGRVCFDIAKQDFDVKSLVTELHEFQKNLFHREIYSRLMHETTCRMKQKANSDLPCVPRINHNCIVLDMPSTLQRITLSFPRGPGSELKILHHSLASGDRGNENTAALDEILLLQAFHRVITQPKSLLDDFIMSHMHRAAAKRFKELIDTCSSVFYIQWWYTDYRYTIGVNLFISNRLVLQACLKDWNISISRSTNDPRVGTNQLCQIAEYSHTCSLPKLQRLLRKIIRLSAC